MVRPHKVNPCTPSRHISPNFFVPAIQATYRMCLLTAWCVQLLRSDCKSMRNWWVYEHLSPYMQLLLVLSKPMLCKVFLWVPQWFSSPKKTNIFKTKFDPECLNSSWISYWEVLSAPGVNEDKKINNLWGNKFQFSLQPRLQTPITIIIIFIIKIAP